MKVKTLKEDECQELMWPNVSLRVVDFQNTFPGDLVNVATTITPELTVADTIAVLEHHTREIAKWILSHRNRFSPEDRFQIIVGWPMSVREAGRQVIKMGGGFDAVTSIADGTTQIVPMHGWASQVFENEDTEQ
jgi:hypothetical protein